MKITPIIIVLLLFLSCNSNHTSEKEEKTVVLNENDGENPKPGTSDSKVIKGLSFPSWIKGVWRNTAESNINNFVVFAFHDSKLEITHGVSFKNGQKISSPYENYTINEEAADSVYSIHLEKENHSISYEFILRKVDWTEEAVLTYSISEDGILKRAHLTSIQLLLVKTK